ncbi:choice-of-anchor D domain-containing protein [Actinoplanes sp. CA-142083]|uniref:choice-of-anchor D domain-containing protein n=1 Tax=Actinoplanes sp. CA-142083 TaxID=3239903 RepID=UPI003D8E7973
MTLVGTVWERRGPSPMVSGSGREDNGLTTVIAVHPNDPDILYQGTAAGGVWRSRDGGAHWTPLFDRQLALGVGEPGGIAFDPNDTSTIFVGTSSRVAQQIAAGLYKSTDGGATVVRLGSGYPADNVGNASQFFRQSINVVIVDPADSRTVYLASSRGVFVSTDGGLNWTPGAGSAGDARTLVLDRSSAAGARILYAGITGRGVFQSTDGGRNWTAILTAATPAVATALGPPPASFGKAVVDIAPPASPPAAGGVQVLYASLAGNGGAPDPVGLFLSTDQGATWTARAATGMPTRTQGGYSFHFAVDPASPGDGANDIIVFGCVGQARSTDSGATFTGMGGLHADTHAWTFVPQAAPAPSVVYCGTDGGPSRSTDAGATWQPLTSGGLQTALIYNLDVRPDATASVSVAALQDNQVETTAGNAGLRWAGTNGGDGWDVVYDGGTAGRMYCTSGFWSPAPCTRVWRSDDDGTNWAEVTPWGTTSDAGCYLSPIATDPGAADTVYVSGNQNLWQSQDAGGTWRIVGSFAGVAEPAVAPTDSGSVVVAVGRRVFVSTDALAAGPTFTDITRNLPSRAVLRAEFDPADPTVIFCVLGGFNGPGPGQQGHVFRTTVAGAAWTDISPPLDVPHGALALDGTDTPTTIYVGTDLGVLRSVDRGISWTVLDDIHFPRAPVTDLVIGRGGNVLRAATYGRGVFELVRPDHPAITVNLERDLSFGSACGGPQYLTIQVFNVGTSELVVHDVQRVLGSTGFSVLPFPGTPVPIRAGEELDFTVAFTPTTPGIAEAATIRIRSNDPGAPVVDLLASGIGGVADAQVIIPDHGDYGRVCAGEFADRDLAVNNAGSCPLVISAVTSSTPDFVPPDVDSWPLVVAPGSTVPVPIRFAPQAPGPVTATVTVFSNDPTGPQVLTLRGQAPTGRLTVTGSADFGPVELGRHARQALTVCNTGECDLHVTRVAFKPPCPCQGVHHHKCGDDRCLTFRIVSSPFPATVHAGSRLDVLIEYVPTCGGSACCELVIESDDPDSPVRTVMVTGQLRRTLGSALKCWAAGELRDILEAGG